MAPEIRNCPVCFLRAKEMEKLIDDLFYENARDPGVNASLARSFGFAAEPMQVALQRYDPLGMSLIYGNIAQSVADRLRNGDSELAPEAPCPLSRRVDQSVMAYQQEFVDHLSERDFRERFQSSFGLCLHHLRKVLALIDDAEDKEWLMQQEAKAFAALAGDLRLFARKTDYLNEEPLGNEADAWQRVEKKFFQVHTVLPEGEKKRHSSLVRRWLAAFRALVFG